MGLGRLLTIFSTALATALGMALIAASIVLSRTGAADCVRYYQAPLLGMGIALTVVGLIGLCGALCNVTWMLIVFYIASVVAMLAMLAFTVFAFIVTNDAVGGAISGKGIHTYRVPEFTSYLQSWVTNPEEWEKLKACIRGSDVCQAVSGLTNTPGGIYNVDLTALQSGCCFLPLACNSTALAPLASAAAAPAPQDAAKADCPLFSSDPNVLCYSCRTCQAGLLMSIRSQWRTIAYFNLTIVLLLALVTCFGGCACRKARREEGFYGGKGPFV